MRLPSQAVFCVADGMGGVAGGDLASEAITTRLHEVFTKAAPSDQASLSGRIALFQKAVDQASQWIKRFADEKGIKQMGSTVVGLLFDPCDPSRAMALHAGDSRLYRYRADELKQLTSDHTAMAVLSTKLGQARASIPAKFQNGLLRAVGLTETVDLEQTPVGVRSGDLFLLCSDGLSRMLGDSAIANILRKQAREALEAPAKTLVNAANAAGGKDNITVILVRAAEAEDATTAVQAEAETIPAPTGSSSISTTVTVDASDPNQQTCQPIESSPGDNPPALPPIPQATPAQEPATQAAPLHSPRSRARSRIGTFAAALLLPLILVSVAIWFQARHRGGLAANPGQTNMSPEVANAKTGSTLVIPEPEAGVRENGPGRTWTNELGMSFVELPNNGFWLGREPITVGQYKQLMGALPGTGTLESDASPEAMAKVTYAEAEQFVERLNRRLRIEGALPADYATGHLAVPSTSQWTKAVDALSVLDHIQALTDAPEWCAGQEEEAIHASRPAGLNRPKFVKSLDSQQDRLALRLVLVP